jgi:hypothetical protein
VGYNFGRVEVLRHLRLTAQRGALLFGRWNLLEGSSGEMQHACLDWTPQVGASRP